jgi:hypothetical protein
VVRLYAHGRWEFTEHERVNGYSVPLFGPHGREYRHPPAALVAQVRRDPQLQSVQITFHADRPAASHPMPPGGFRLALVNCLDLAAGRAALAPLAAFFDV